MATNGSNDTTSPGYLTPTTPDADYDEALEQQLGQWIQALSGLAADRVRPRWPATQAEQPAAEVDWCAFGIISFDRDANPAFVQQGAAGGELQCQEVIECEALFYGANGQQIATRFRDGVTVSQNSATFNTMGMSLLDCSKLTSSPELVNNQWQRRYDMTLRLGRKIIREYGIKTLADAPVTFFGE
ncbi:hypothetical protein J2125_000921 [Erwinia toletana]|uniref:Phage neck terminator protein gp12-like domain-containing protein n=1 Tax=Winslowiella toletana TaxID=92490 RepID=A0ABS4P508_9GAMM|nr:hypothetical protein [Winslowiella toletana]MBP2167729.1 hypothetical protein [Winslowiella toletana]